jgi:hypothetical protein
MLPPLPVMIQTLSESLFGMVAPLGGRWPS